MHWKSQERGGYMIQTLLNRSIQEARLPHDIQFVVGDHVRVRRSIRAPLQGHCGRILEINMGDARAPYLLELDNGLKFRYRYVELQRIL
jgi:hypothetical protein